MSRDTARKVLEIESEAIRELIPRLDESFDRAVDALYACRGRVVVTGMGKSRLLETHGYSLLDRSAADCMTRSPILVGRKELATRALHLLEARKITSLLVADEQGRIEGVLHLHDLWKTEMI